MLSKCKGLTKEMLRSANAQIALLPENGKVLLDNERIRSLALYRMIFLYFAAMKKQLVYKAIANKYDISYREARPIAFVGWVLQDDRAFRNACQASLKTQEIFSLWTLTNELQAFGKRLDIVRHAIKMAANGVSYTARRSYVKRAVADLVPPKPPKPKAPPLDEKSIKLDNIPQKYRAPMITHLERLRDRDHAISSGYTHFGETEVRYYSDERGRTHLSIVADGPDSVVLDNIIGKLMGRDDGVGHTNKELKYRLGRQLMDFLVDKSKLRIDMMVGGTLSSWLGIDMAQRMFTNGYGIFDPAGITKLLARYGPKAQKVTTAIAITDDEGKQLIDYSEGRTAPTWMRKMLGILSPGAEDNKGNAPLVFCQVHHMKPYSEGGPTSLRNSILLSATEHGRRARPEMFGDTVRDQETYQPYLQYPDGTREEMNSKRKHLGMLSQIQKEVGDRGKDLANQMCGTAPSGVSDGREAEVFEIMRGYLKMMDRITQNKTVLPEPIVPQGPGSPEAKKKSAAA